jgi:hypothetical protein
VGNRNDTVLSVYTGFRKLICGEFSNNLNSSLLRRVYNFEKPAAKAVNWLGDSMARQLKATSATRQTHSLNPKKKATAKANPSSHIGGTMATETLQQNISNHLKTGGQR